jgi:talin
LKIFCIIQILTFATTIAKHTSTLCNISRDASSNTTNPMARRNFVQSAKDVANTTAELVRKIKVEMKFLSTKMNFL